MLRAYGLLTILFSAQSQVTISFKFFNELPLFDAANPMPSSGIDLYSDLKLLSVTLQRIQFIQYLGEEAGS